MKSASPPLDHTEHNGGESFSLTQGGLFFQLMHRVGLADDTFRILRKRIIVLSLFAWLPILVLSALNGQFLSEKVALPFIWDIDAHVRLLVAMPLLLVAELAVHVRLRLLARDFLTRHLIPEHAVTRFNAAIASAIRLRNSTLAEVLLIGFVYAVGIMIIWRHHIRLDMATWYAAPSGSGINPTLAGLWYGCVSLPLFQFLLCRWYFRLAIWTRFLWQVARINLSLVPAHPDRLGGLGFLPGISYALAPLAIAHGTIAAGFIANRVFFGKASLSDFTAEIAILLIFVLCITAGPLLVFTQQLGAAKRRGNREYAGLAERYIREFDAKWLRGGAADDEILLGSSDIQSLSDLANSFQIVASMRAVPLTINATLELAIMTLAPIAPLLLTIMSQQELVRMLFGLLVW